MVNLPTVTITRLPNGRKYEWVGILINTDDFILIDFGIQLLDRISAHNNLTAGALMRLFTGAEINGNYIEGTVIGMVTDQIRTYNGISQPAIIPTTNKFRLRITTDGSTTGDLTVVATYLRRL